METTLFLTASLSLLIWLYLIFLRAGFWQVGQQVDGSPPEPSHWPGVAAIIATSEDADAIEETLPDLLHQAYPGSFHVILVDDRGRDGTVNVARRVARAAGAVQQLSVLRLGEPPAGWSRRAWALARAQEHVAANLPAVRYLWLTEPWVQHGYHSLTDLVTKAEADRCALVSWLPFTACETPRDRLLAPAFTFFFQAFHPLARISDPRHAAAATVPGCVLVDANALNAAGGFTALKDASVLETVLAANVKSAAQRNGQGISVGLGDDSTSARSGDELKALRNLVRSTVDTQLRASPIRLAASFVAVALACLAPPVIFLWALIAGIFLDIDQFLITFLAMLVACGAWIAMSFAAWPTFELYEQEEWRTLLLPLGAAAHIVLTMVLMLRHSGPRQSRERAIGALKDNAQPRS